MEIMSHLKVRAWCAALLALAFAAPASAAENPMERAGIEHNFYLDCLMRVEAKPDESELRLLVEVCGHDPGMPVEDFEKLYEPLVNEDPTKSAVERMSPHRHLYSEYEFGFFARIDAVVANATDLVDARKQLDALEQEAIARLSPEKAGGRNVLTMFATMRHSLDYWTASAAGAGHDVNVARFPWKELIVAVVDAIGTVLAGPPVGSAASKIAKVLLDVFWPNVQQH